MPSMGGSGDYGGDDVSGTGIGGGIGGGENSRAGYGGFGGLGIGNPGSYGGIQSVGAPGFSGGYGSDGGAYQSNEGALQSLYDSLYAVQQTQGIPKLAKAALPTLLSAMGIPFGGVMTMGLDKIAGTVGKRNATLDAMREAGVTDEQLADMFGRSPVSTFGSDSPAMWGSDWQGQTFVGMPGGSGSGDAGGAVDAAPGSTAGATGGLADDWRAFEDKFMGLGDQIMSDYQNRMSGLPQLDLKLPGRMGGGNVPLAPGKWAAMAGDQARVEGGIMDRMAEAGAMGIGGRQDIWRTKEQIENQINMQNRAIDANEPSAWESWAPVVASGVDTIFNTDWGEVADTIGGWF